MCIFVGNIYDMLEKKKISLVVSVYNEEAMIDTFYQETIKVVDGLISEYVFKLIFVNDGSSDNSLAKLTALTKKDGRVKVINFSRNFGHEAAMLAGIDHSDGEAVICMDADLQHPPTMMPQMLSKFADGAQVVNMVRKSRQDKGIFRRLFNYIFYKTLNKLSDQKIEPNATDFFLISKQIVDNLKVNYRNNIRFVRGVIQNIGFKQEFIPFHAPERTAGESKYSFGKLVKLAFTAFTTHTLAPLKAGIFLGLLFSLHSLILFGYSVFMWFYDRPIGGYTTLITFISFAFAILFILIGIIGDYLGKVFLEAKKLPPYIVDNIIDGNADENKA
jgi:glycosyltransferase involved in cell wall biosynthesis